MGFVKIGSFLVPESSKPAERFVCRLCPRRFATPDGLAAHIQLQHVRREEAETKEHSLQQRIPEFYAGDTEREEFVRSDRGRREWARKTGDRSVLKPK